MRIDEILRNKRTLSFEVFPPKKEMDSDLSGIRKSVSELREAHPDFVSVTYGAGGGNRNRALDIARMLLSFGLNPLSHLTAVGYSEEDASAVLDALEDLGVENVLALRGDIPRDSPEGLDHWRTYARASELVRFIGEAGVFCIGGAAYPEGHQDSVSPERDLEFMREKVEAGVSFFITQLFFDNDHFLRFADSVRSSVGVPIIAGIMPVFRASQIKGIIRISGCSVPARLSLILEKYDSDDESMREAGIEYASDQINDLWNRGGVGVHLYTMNKSQEILEILKRCELPGRLK
jgi:methylenetetrahydrofolate reductase (NADPH)